MRNPRFSVVVCLAAVLFSLISSSSAQSSPRCLIDDSVRTRLSGTVSAQALAARDLGPASAAMPIRRMQLVLSRSSQQESALNQLLNLQQDPASPSYRRFLSPSDFGRTFGPSDDDLATLTTWLATHGLTAIQPNAGRTLIEFSGTAHALQSAFHISVHMVSQAGSTFYTNLSDPDIPSALKPLVTGIASLNNLPRQASASQPATFTRDSAGTLHGIASPNYTLNSNNQTYYPVTPYDFAAIYDVLPLWSAGNDGTGQTIAVVGDTDINPADFVNFRKLFSLPLGATTSQTGTQYLNIIYNGPTPAVKPDEFQADSDTQWAAAVAKGAVIDYVASQSTEVSNGADLSAAYVIDNNLASILSYSASACEAALGPGGNGFYKNLWQQAAAQGITVLVPSGGTGAAGCDPAYVAPAQQGIAVNGIGSTPYNVSVGGTEFYTPAGQAHYFNAANDPVTHASARGYIPEIAWNDTCTNPAILAQAPYTGLSAEQACNTSAARSAGLTGLAGTGGGPSSIYSKPTWQTAPGVPADTFRDTPDVALFASQGRTNNFYIVCQQSRDTDGKACNLDYPYADFAAYGGTNIATPAMAGLLALVAQSTGARLGNPNPVLYRLATNKPAAFHDITQGTNTMPCVTGTPNCITSTTGDTYGILSAPPATQGYDLATGLGSVDAANLVAAWPTVIFAPVTAILTATPQTIVHGQSVATTVTVSSGSGAAPTGTVALEAQTGTGFIGTGTLTAGIFNGSFTTFPGGSYGVRALYSGDQTYAATDSNFVSLTVAPEPSSARLQTLQINPTTNAASNVTTAPYGSIFFLRTDVTGLSGQGTATGNVLYTDSGAPLGSGTYRLNSSGYTEAQINQLTPGTHSFTAAYAGDSSFTASTAPTQTLTITRAPTIATVSATPTPVSQAATVTFAAHIATQSYGLYAPTGTVTFSTGTTVLGTSRIQQGTDPVTLTDSASATLTLSAGVLALGSDPITVQYSGDLDYLPATSASAPLTVTPTTLIPTNTAVTVTPTTAAPGGTITFSATVHPATGSGIPTGTIQFAVDGQNFSAPVPCTAAQAILTTSVASLATGSHTVTAVYSGDTTYRSSISVPTPFVIAASGTPSVPLATITPTTAVQGTFIVVAVQLTPTSPSATGTVQLILDGGTYGSPLPLTAGSATLPLVTTTLQVGTHVVSVFYSGDSTYTPSYAANAQILITAPGIAPSAVSLTGPAQISSGTAGNFTASVTPASPTPTGILQVILDNGSPSLPILLSNGLSNLTLPSSLALGTHTLRVFYSGDATYNFATSQTLTFQVIPSTFIGSFTLSPATASMIADRLQPSPRLTYTVTPNTGFNYPVTFACANLPANTACSFSPASVQISGTTSASSVLTLILNTGVKAETRSSAIPSLIAFAGLLAIFRRRRLRTVFATLLLAALLTTLSGCGSGYRAGTSPPGTYTVTVVASGGNVTQTSTLHLTIN